MQEVNKSLVDKAQKSEKQHRMENAFSTPLQNRDRLQVITSFLGGASDFIPARECAAIRSAPLPMLRKPRELFEGLFFGEIAFFLTAVTAMIFYFFFLLAAGTLLCSHSLLFPSLTLHFLTAQLCRGSHQHLLHKTLLCLLIRFHSSRQATLLPSTCLSGSFILFQRREMGL